MLDTSAGRSHLFSQTRICFGLHADVVGRWATAMVPPIVQLMSNEDSVGRRPVLWVVLAGLWVATVGCGGSSPPAPTPTTTSVSVTYPGGTIFIGNAVQFEARETLSDGTSRTATNVTWASDSPAVATVSATGLVTAMSAGEVTISAGTNPTGTMRIRVYPSFGGMWAGTEVVKSCDAIGMFQGICSSPDFPGPGVTFPHHSVLGQTQAAVNAEIDTGDGTKATTTGTVTVGGELQLLPTPVLPADPTVNVVLQNWRSRADAPSRMTGTYEGYFTAPGTSGSVTIVIELQDVTKTSASVGTGPGLGGNVLDRAMHGVVTRLEHFKSLQR